MATQQEMPHRLRFRLLSDVPDENWFIYKGHLSLAANPVDCFRENDNPIEFFVNVNKYTGEIEVKLSVRSQLSDEVTAITPNENGAL